MNPYSHKIPRKTASRLLLFITLLIISLQVPAQETDEYGWRKSDTQVIGHYSGGNKTVTLTSNASGAFFVLIWLNICHFYIKLWRRPWSVYQNN